MDMTAIIDRSVLDELRTLGGPGDDLLGEVIGVFLAEGPGQVRRVNEALASRDAPAIQRAAFLDGVARLVVGAGDSALVPDMREHALDYMRRNAKRFVHGRADEAAQIVQHPIRALAGDAGV